MNMNHASIIGEDIDNNMIRELNHRLLAIETPFSIEKEFSKIVINQMGFSICGTEKEDAYAQFEILLKGFEFTPMLIYIPLKGNTGTGLGLCNKDFFKHISSGARQIIENYCRELVNLLTFVRLGATLEESLAATIESFSDSLHINGLKVYTFDVVMDGVTFLMELEGSIKETHNTMLLVITSKCDSHYTVSNFYVEIDSKFVGSAKEILDYETKASIINFCRNLSALYAAPMSVFDVELALLDK